MTLASKCVIKDINKKGLNANYYYLGVRKVTKTVSQVGECPTSTAICDFESDDICGYTYDETADFLWQRKKGPMPTTDTGPSVGDHSTGTAKGYYMVTGKTFRPVPVKALCSENV